MSNIWDKYRDETYERAAGIITGRRKEVTYRALREVTGISIETMKKYLDVRPMLKIKIGIVEGPRSQERRSRDRSSKQFDPYQKLRLFEAAAEIWGSGEIPRIPLLACEAEMEYRTVRDILRRDTRLRHTLVENYHLVIDDGEL